MNTTRMPANCPIGVSYRDYLAQLMGYRLDAVNIHGVVDHPDGSATYTWSRK